MRVLHCPFTMADNPWVLSRAERKLGLESDVMIFSNTWAERQADVDLNLNPRNPFWAAPRLLAYFLRAIPKYDVFHFNYGSSFIPQVFDLKGLELLDVVLLKKLGKVVVVTYQGGDARPTWKAGGDSRASDDLKQRRVKRFCALADRVFALNPDLLKWLPPWAEFLPYSSVDLKEWQAVPPQNGGGNGRLLVVHAPSNRKAKGTEHVIEAVDRLRADGYPVELKVVENTVHSKARRIYAKADIAVDQLLVGWYGGFAVEMMALGKPVICHINEDGLRFVPQPMQQSIPAVNATPKTLYSLLGGLVDSRLLRESLSKTSREYVEEYHDPMKIAQRTKEAYESAKNA